MKDRQEDDDSDSSAFPAAATPAMKNSVPNPATWSDKQEVWQEEIPFCCPHCDNLMLVSRLSPRRKLVNHMLECFEVQPCIQRAEDELLTHRFCIWWHVDMSQRHSGICAIVGFCHIALWGIYSLSSWGEHIQSLDSYIFVLWTGQSEEKHVVFHKWDSHMIIVQSQPCCGVILQWQKRFANGTEDLKSAI